MRRIKLTVEYEGTKFHGWQRQPGTRTVQGEIEKALERITNQKVTLHVAGRTDAGVHANAQICHFDVDSKVPLVAFKRGVNRFTSEDVSILKAEEVTEDFHARHSATWRCYTFRILNRAEPSSILRDHAVFVRPILDFDKMTRALSHIVGEHNFNAFRAADCESGTPVCNIFEATLTKDGENITLRIQGDHFLHNMIRITMGTLVDIGCGKLPESTFKTMLKSGNRADGGVTLPPQGLYFTQVGYPEHVVIEATPD